MTFTNYPNGLTSFGIPLLGGGRVSIPNRENQVLFVDQTGRFSAMSQPTFTTIQDAINAVQNAAGSTIFVFPGTYEENLEIDDEKDYLSIIGAMIPGYARPDIVPASGIVLEVLSQGFVAQHMRFAGSDSDVVVQRGNGFEYNDCVFDGDAAMAATEAALRLVGVAADDSYTASEGLIANSLFRGTATGAGLIFQHAANPSGVGVTDVQVLGNRFYANGVDILTAVNASGGGAGILLNCEIGQNRFMTVGAAYVYANMAAGAAGDLAANSCLHWGNWFADDALIAAQYVIAGQANQMFIGNYDAAGLVDGSTFNN